MAENKDIREGLKEMRKEKDMFFKNNARSPIPQEEKENFEGLNYFPIDLDYLYKLRLLEYEKNEIIEVNDNKGSKQEFIRWGYFDFTVNGKEVTLNAYKSDPEEARLWVPFKDATNGEETYGAGRYIDLHAQNKIEEKWILDFNQAYNPFCAYSEDYVCPLIPSKNWLEVRIEAGEKKYK